MPCFSLGDDRRGTSGSRDISLTIFITSMSGSESLTSFDDRFFHLSGPLGLRFAFDAAERNERVSRIQCQRSKESSSRGKRKRRVFLCRKRVRIEVKSKLIPTSFFLLYFASLLLPLLSTTECVKIYKWAEFQKKPEQHQVTQKKYR